jgi:hypothetical protein
MAQPAAVAFLAIGVFVLVTTFPGRRHIMVPSLLGVFGVPFAVVFLVAQYALVGALRSWRGFALVTAVLLVGMGLGGCGTAMDLWGELAEHNVPALRHVLVGGVCASGIALGAAVLKGWVAPAAGGRGRLQK